MAGYNGYHYSQLPPRAPIPQRRTASSTHQALPSTRPTSGTWALPQSVSLVGQSRVAPDFDDFHPAHVPATLRSPSTIPVNGRGIPFPVSAGKKRDLLESSYLPMAKKQPILDQAPPSAGNLVTYGKYVERYKKGHGSCSSAGNGRDDGKLATSKYGATFKEDLGLCYKTFCTTKPCVYGKECRWRHEQLTNEEQNWMCALGANCVEFLDECWSMPCEPQHTLWYTPFMFIK